MNLTEAEAEAIGRFARGIRSTTSARARGLTATDLRLLERMSVDNDRAKLLTGDFGTFDDDAPPFVPGTKVKKPEPEPETPRNRFSGLDIE